MAITSEKDILRIFKILSPIIAEYDLDNIDIVDTISSYQLLQLDRELWNKFNPDVKYLLKEVENDELIINRGRIKFYIKGDGDYNYPIKKDTFGFQYIEEKKEK